MESLIALLTMATALAQSPPGRMVDVGGYRLHLNCTGSGSPAVIAIGGFSFDWALVQPAVAALTRICTYDASGNAWSDPGPQPDCPNRVEEIHRLLHNAGIEPPYVLTGFSAGALFARLYAKTYPAEVTGVVFVDHAYLPAVVPPAPTPDGPDTLPVLISKTPIAMDIDDEPGADRLSPEIRNLHRWAMSRNPALPDKEMAEGCIAAIGDATLSHRPLVVIRTENDSPGYRDLQTSLLALSHRSSQVIATRSFHSIEISQPDIVIQAIRQVVEASRK